MRAAPEFIFAVGSLGLVALGAAGAVIYVDDTASGSGANDGTSWENAFTNLHDGLSAAGSGDEVRIGQGTYRPVEANGAREGTFNLPAKATVQGGFAGFGAANPDQFSPKEFETILSGDLSADDGTDFANNGENSYHVVSAEGVDESTVLRGVTITAGNADLVVTGGLNDPHIKGAGLVCVNGATPTVDQCIIRNNSAWGFGAGIFGSPVLTNCSIQDNRMFPAGDQGAGAGLYGGASITDCQFINNHDAGNGGGASSGGVFRRCSFEMNSADTGGGLGTAGGQGGPATAIDCTFIGNDGFLGGAVSASDGEFINCTFLGNGASNGSAFYAMIGGGLQVVNCLFSGNSSGNAGVIGVPDGVTVINSTFTGNHSNYNHGVIASFAATIDNCIFWQNTNALGGGQSAQVSTGTFSEPTINFSFVEGWDGSLGGEGNFGGDPGLVDPDGTDNDYGTEDDNSRLTEESQCRDAGNTSALPDDETDLDEDGDTVEQIPLDLDLNARVVNDVVDVGAYEHPGAGTGCAGDIAPEGGDGQVSVPDLLAVIQSWGDCPPSGECPSDLSDDGVTNIDDLLMVIQSWGACP